MVYAIIITSLSLLLSLRTSKNIFAPATLVSALWLFCIVAYNIYPHNLLPLRTQFYTGISIWVGVFTVSSLFTQSIYQKANNKHEPNLSVQNFYFFISILSFPLVLWDIYNLLSSMGLLDNIFLNLRNAAMGKIKGLEEGTSNNYFAPLWLVSYIIELLHYNKKRRVYLLLLLFINFSWAFLIMSKMAILNIFLSTLVVLFFKNKIKPKAIIISLAILFVFFTFFQLLRSTKSEINKNELKYDFFSLYVLAGIPAFETVKPASSESFGENTFRFFNAVKYKTGLTNKKAASPVLEFIFVDKNNKVYSNVYTTLYPFFKDFGFKGIFYFAILIGVFYGYIFKKAINKSNPMLVVYSILITSIATQFMNETIITTMSFLIQILLISHLPYWFNKKVSMEIKN